MLYGHDFPPSFENFSGFRILISMRSRINFPPFFLPSTNFTYLSRLPT